MLKHEAILLLGPTGSGKSPLGEALEKHGLAGRPCSHFDFGAQLRHVAEHGAPGLQEKDVAQVRYVLKGGALLENDTFYIARAILEAFLARQTQTNPLLVLNGLPRHAGQADDVGGILRVILVAALECRAETVYERIARNSGGDRTARTDDSIPEIGRKLELYAARTQPLLDYYRKEGVPCRIIPVGVETTPGEVISALEDAV
jgi:adenylate kinase family enzyme